MKNSRKLAPCAARFVICTVLLVPALHRSAHAQRVDTAQPDAPQAQAGAQAPDNDKTTLRNVPLNLLKDQEGIWTSPLRIRESNAIVPVTLVLATTVLITTDHQVMSSSKLQNTSLNNEATTASTGLLGGFVALPVAMYGLGYLKHDDHATETGILGGEAMLNGLAVSEVMKFVSLRERPTIDSAKGRFFQTSVGSNSSFPSNHSVIAWSSAAVVASEYGGPLTQVTAYGLATGVSLTRVLGRDHFPSDVFVGSAVGWLIGRYVVHRHAHWADLRTR